MLLKNQANVAYNVAYSYVMQPIFNFVTICLSLDKGLIMTYECISIPLYCSVEEDNQDIEDGEILDEPESNDELPCTKSSIELSDDVSKQRDRQHFQSKRRRSTDGIENRPEKRTRNEASVESRNDPEYVKRRRGRPLGRDRGRRKGKQTSSEEEEAIFVLGGSLDDEKVKSDSSPRRKKPLLPDPPPSWMENDDDSSDSQFRRRRMKRTRPKGSLREKRNEVCMYFMQGKCIKGTDCPFTHTSPSTTSHASSTMQRKAELCKFYLMDCCAKKDKCSYMHSEFPCKYHHTGLQCYAGSNCKFSHEELNDTTRQILIKHLETATKDILGDFPRKLSTQIQSSASAAATKKEKIPSLFDIKVSLPAEFQGYSKSTYTNAENDEKNTIASPQSDSDERIMDNWSMIRGETAKSDEEMILKLKEILHNFITKIDENNSDLIAEDITILIKNVEDCTKKIFEESEKDEIKILLKDLRKFTQGDVILNYAVKSRLEEFLKIDQEITVNKEEEGEKDTEKLPVKGEEESYAKLKVIDENDNAAKLPKDISYFLGKIQMIKNSIGQDDNNDQTNDDIDVRYHMDDDSQKTTIPPNKKDSLDSKDELGLSNESPTSSTHLSILPKKQQELFLRIQQQQRDESSSSKDVNEDEDDDAKDDDWYSSDEENEERKLSSKSSNMLNNILNVIKQKPSPTVVTYDKEESNVELNVEESSSVNDAVSRLLQSFRNATPPMEMKPNEQQLDIASSMLNSKERSNLSLLSGSLENNSQDIDFRKLRIERIPVHEAAEEIDGMSHVFPDYKLIPIAYNKPDYSSVDISKVHPNDPRVFRKKTEEVNEPIVEDLQPKPIPELIKSDAPVTVPLMSYRAVDPRLADVQQPTIDPRMYPSFPIKCDPRLQDIRDPRLEVRDPRLQEIRDPRLNAFAREDMNNPTPFAAPPHNAPAYPRQAGDPRVRANMYPIVNNVKYSQYGFPY